MNKSITIFSPATVANVSCGFDVLGLCLESVGDKMIIKTSQKKGVRITKIEGHDLPTEVSKNVAGISALALVNDLKPSIGFDIEIYKGIKPGSGIGSSAASAVGSVYAINELMGKPYTDMEILEFAMKGEALASGCEHADNIAPALFGGFTLVKNINPLHVLNLPSTSNLHVVILHPQIEVKTSEARKILPEMVAIEKAIKQSANLGSLVHALHTHDFNLLSDSLSDVIIEPYRSTLIPHFHMVKKTAIEHGALGCGISGSGPSIFSICKDITTANEVSIALDKFYSTTEIDYKIYNSPISKQGVKTI